MLFTYPVSLTSTPSYFCGADFKGRINNLLSTYHNIRFNPSGDSFTPCKQNPSKSGFDKEIALIAQPNNISNFKHVYKIRNVIAQKLKRAGYSIGHYQAQEHHSRKSYPEDFCEFSPPHLTFMVLDRDNIRPKTTEFKILRQSINSTLNASPNIQLRFQNIILTAKGEILAVYKPTNENAFKLREALSSISSLDNIYPNIFHITLFRNESNNTNLKQVSDILNTLKQSTLQHDLTIQSLTLFFNQSKKGLRPWSAISNPSFHINLLKN